MPYRSINYELELFPTYGNLNPFGAITNLSPGVLIYHYNLQQFFNTYWNAWGGYSDNVTSTNISITYGVQLVQVFNQTNLINNVNTFYIDGNDLYFHLPKYNYLFSRSEISISKAEYYTVSVLDTFDETQPFLNGFPYNTRLNTPSFVSKLSDDFSGLVLLQRFSVSLINDDGLFDDVGNNLIKRYIGNLARVRKTEINNPSYPSDWTTILEGNVDDVQINLDSIVFTISDKLKDFDQPVCNLFTAGNYPNIPASNINKNIPIAYNQNLQRDLIKIDDSATQPGYLFVDSAYYSSLISVYDSDGNVIPPAQYTNNGDGTITMNIGFVNEPDKVDFNANSGVIGSIIHTEISKHAGILYIAANWDITETNLYIAKSPTPSLYFDGASLKELIDDLLKNDTIYLITLPDGRLTIRHYWNDEILYTGTNEYANHVIDSRYFMPEVPAIRKRFTNIRYYASSVLLNRIGGTTENIAYRNLALQYYNKIKQRVFESILYILLPTDQTALFADYLARRYYLRREIIEVSLGLSVLNMKLLDTITCNFEINDRGRFTKKQKFKIISIDYAQDKLILEEAG